VADFTGYEARYVSFHAIDIRPPLPSYGAVYDGELWAHYGPGEEGGGEGRREGKGGGGGGRRATD